MYQDQYMQSCAPHVILQWRWRHKSACETRRHVGPWAFPEVSISFHISLVKCQEDTLGSSQMQDLYAEGPVD